MLSYILPALYCPRPADVLSDSLCKYPMIICRCSVQGRAKRPFIEMKMRTCLRYPTAMKIPNAGKRSGTNLYPMSALGLHILTPPILLKNLLFNRKTVLAASKSSPFNFSSQTICFF